MKFKKEQVRQAYLKKLMEEHKKYSKPKLADGGDIPDNSPIGKLTQKMSSKKSNLDALLEAKDTAALVDEMSQYSKSGSGVIQDLTPDEMAKLHGYEQAGEEFFTRKVPENIPDEKALVPTNSKGIPGIGSSEYGKQSAEIIQDTAPDTDAKIRGYDQKGEGFYTRKADPVLNLIDDSLPAIQKTGSDVTKTKIGNIVNTSATEIPKVSKYSKIKDLIDTVKGSKATKIISNIEEAALKHPKSAKAAGMAALAAGAMSLMGENEDKVTVNTADIEDKADEFSAFLRNDNKKLDELAKKGMKHDYGLSDNYVESREPSPAPSTVEDIIPNEDSDKGETDLDNKKDTQDNDINNVVNDLYSKSKNDNDFFDNLMKEYEAEKKKGLNKKETNEWLSAISYIASSMGKALGVDVGQPLTISSDGSGLDDIVKKADIYKKIKGDDLTDQLGIARYLNKVETDKYKLEQGDERIGIQKQRTGIGQERNAQQDIINFNKEYNKYAKGLEKVRDLDEILGNIDVDLSDSHYDFKTKEVIDNKTGKAVDIPGMNIPGLGRQTLLDAQAQIIDAIATTFSQKERHELFGATLTQNELADFNEAIAKGKFNSEAQFLYMMQKMRKSILSQAARNEQLLSPDLKNDLKYNAGYLFSNDIQPGIKPEQTIPVVIGGKTVNVTKSQYEKMKANKSKRLEGK